MNRMQFIDISKGISILLMTLTHLEFITKYEVIKNFNSEYLIIFKMPLFLMISGFLYKPNKSNYSFILKKIDGLIKPSLSALALFGLIGIVIYSRNFNVSADVLQQSIFYSSSVGIGLWFVISLFISLSVVNILYTLYLRSTYLFILALLGAFLVLLALNLYDINFLIFILSTLIYFVLYLFIGILFKKYKILDKVINFRFLLLLFLLFSTLVVVKKFINVDLRLYSNHYDPILVALSYSCIGAFIILNIANVLTRTRYISGVLVACGQSSFFI